MYGAYGRPILQIHFKNARADPLDPKPVADCQFDPEYVSEHPGCVLSTQTGYGTTPVWCRSGNRYDEGCWGFHYLKMKVDYFYLYFHVAVSYVYFCFPTVILVLFVIFYFCISMFAIFVCFKMSVHDFQES